MRWPPPCSSLWHAGWKMHVCWDPAKGVLTLPQAHGPWLYQPLMCPVSEMGLLNKVIKTGSVRMMTSSLECPIYTASIP